MIPDNLGPAIDAFDDYLARAQREGTRADMDTLLDHADWLEAQAKQYRACANKIFDRTGGIYADDPKCFVCVSGSVSETISSETNAQDAAAMAAAMHWSKGASPQVPATRIWEVVEWKGRSAGSPALFSVRVEWRDNEATFISSPVRIAIAQGK